MKYDNILSYIFYKSINSFCAFMSYGQDIFLCPSYIYVYICIYIHMCVYVYLWLVLLALKVQHILFGFLNLGPRVGPDILLKWQHILVDSRSYMYESLNSIPDIVTCGPHNNKNSNKCYFGLKITETILRVKEQMKGMKSEWYFL